MDQVLAAEILKKHGKALSIEMLEMVLVPALENLAKQSVNAYDDAFIALIKEPLKAELKKLIEGL